MPSRWGRRRMSGSSTTSSPERIQPTGSGPTTSHAGSSRTGSCESFRGGDRVHQRRHCNGARRCRAPLEASSIWIVGGGDGGQFADAGPLDDALVTIARVTSAGAPSASASARAAPGRGGTEWRLRLRKVRGRAMSSRAAAGHKEMTCTLILASTPTSMPSRSGSRPSAARFAT